MYVQIDWKFLVGCTFVQIRRVVPIPVPALTLVCGDSAILHRLQSAGCFRCQLRSALSLQIAPENWDLSSLNSIYTLPTLMLLSRRYGALRAINSVSISRTDWNRNNPALDPFIRDTFPGSWTQLLSFQSLYRILIAISEDLERHFVSRL